MPESGRPAQGGGPVGGKATFQAESLTAPELSERPATCGEAANRFLREQPENYFHVVDDRHQVVPIGKHCGVTEVLTGRHRFLGADFTAGSGRVTVRQGGAFHVEGCFIIECGRGQDQPRGRIRSETPSGKQERCDLSGPKIPPAKISNE
jgi:hypothetical protein